MYFMQARLLHPASPPMASDSAIMATLQQQGYQVSVTDKNVLYRKVLTLLGGLESIGWLYEEMMLRLCLNAQIRKGQAYSLPELKSIAQPQERTPQFYDIMAQLIAKGIFKRGYSLSCPYCDFFTWYALPIAEAQSCAGCGAIFQPPLELPFAYQPNTLFSNALRNGAVTVLLFLHQMRSVSLNFTWGAGYQVSKGRHTTDLDLVTLLGDVLVVVECKDDFTDWEARTVKTQLEKTLAVADDLNADAFLFATLKPTIPKEIQALFDEPKTTGALPRLMGRQALLNGINFDKSDDSKK